jgi:GTP diphosphokinase / guanosine-3',5'-bis(diphosphate) 3'-diphosphatase
VDFERRAEDLAARLGPADGVLVRRAFRLALSAHAGQRRRHGAPYIEHPVDVAWIAFERFGMRGGAVLAAALLHDVLEDTAVTDLAEVPDRTVELVRLLTDPCPDMTSAERAERYREIWRDPEATLLKASDRLSNLADALRQHDPRFRARYAARTRRELLAPGLPLAAHPVAGPLLEAAVRRCEADRW